MWGWGVGGIPGTGSSEHKDTNGGIRVHSGNHKSFRVPGQAGGSGDAGQATWPDDVASNEQTPVKTGK